MMSAATSVAFVVALGGVLLALYVRAGRHSEQEAGNIPRYERRCAIVLRDGMIVSGGNIPIFRVAVHDSMIVVTTLSARPLTIKRQDIERVAISDALDSSDLVLHVKLGGSTRTIHLWCGDKGRLANEIRKQAFGMLTHANPC